MNATLKAVIIGLPAAIILNFALASVIGYLIGISIYKMGEEHTLLCNTTGAFLGAFIVYRLKSYFDAKSARSAKEISGPLS